MRKDISKLMSKLKDIDLEQYTIKKEEPKEQQVKNNLYIVILTNEERYKIESVFIYSLDIGEEYTVEYKKEFISDMLLEDTDILTKLVSYIFYVKPDNVIVPMKECIITGVEDKEDSLSITFKVGPEESDAERQSHRFVQSTEDEDKFIFIGKFI